MAPLLLPALLVHHCATTILIGSAERTCCASCSPHLLLPPIPCQQAAAAEAGAAEGVAPSATNNAALHALQELFANMKNMEVGGWQMGLLLLSRLICWSCLPVVGVRRPVASSRRCNVQTCKLRDVALD